MAVQGHEVKHAKEEMMDLFNCDEIGEHNKEYFGWKVDDNIDSNGQVKISKSLLLQSFQDEFEIPDEKYLKTIQ